jgi:type II secretory pathway pseudopilin PulG
MNVDVENKINDLILQEQTLQEQLRSVQLQKTRLQTVLQVWNECSADPSFYTYVAQVTENFKTVVPEPTTTTQTTTQPVAMETTTTVENTTTTTDPATVQ